MKRKNTTRNALVMSVLSMLLCVSMLVGTTFAWFTDEVASGSNVIASGNLDIAVEYTLDGETWKNLDGANDLFQMDLWEPGHTEVVALRITNKGSLALKYAATMHVLEEIKGVNKDGAEFALSDILTVSTLTQQANDIGDISLMLAFMGENSVGYQTTTAFKSANILKAEQELHVGEAHYIIIKVDMPETVGNEANHNGEKAPSINFGLNVLATQYAYEEDSFGNDYDKDAEIPVVASSAAELQAALNNAAAGDIIALGADLVVTGENMLTVPTGADVIVDLNGHNITANFAEKTDGASAVFTINKNASLTINGEGNVHVTAAPTMNYVSSIFTNLGSLEINGGNYSMTYGTYAEGYLIPTIIDTNSNVGKATTTINGGTFTHTRNMFRNFAQAQRGENNATLIINGGTFTGLADDFATIWNQKTSASGVEGDGIVIVNGGDFTYVNVENDFNSGVTIADGVNLQIAE